MTQPPGFEAVLPVITRRDDDPGPDAATYHPSQEEPMTETEPTLAQVEAMEKALGCRRMFAAAAAPHGDACIRHASHRDWTDLGCEGAKIALRQLTDTRRERDEARAALDRVRALHEDGGGWCCGDHGQEGALWPCATVRAIDGPTS